ncbi:hypothetical protein JKY79_01230 [Candidatus Babeliales bacterium]|nr:hypothetical protein [Candidatus Babeliales bacterium]
MADNIKTVHTGIKANKETRLSGNILLFYSFDIGDDIDISEIRKKRMVDARFAAVSPYFKNYHMPLVVNLEDCYSRKKRKENREDCIASKVHHFGVVSFCYKIPFNATFEEIRTLVIENEKKYDAQSDQDCQVVFEIIHQAIAQPVCYNLKNMYCAVQVNPLSDGTQPDAFKSMYGNSIVSLLRFEKQHLSEYQTEEVLASTTGYYGQDFVIIDNEASFIYDNDYYESLDFFEFANIQKLELQYFDRLLDKKLNYFYSQSSYKIPWKAYIPFFKDYRLGEIYSLAKLRVDIAVITERLGNSIKMAGEPFYENLYSMLVGRLSLRTWKDSIDKKMDIIKDVYTVHQDNLTTGRGEILTIVIIVLIALEGLLLVIR